MAERFDAALCTSGCAAFVDVVNVVDVLGAYRALPSSKNCHAFRTAFKRCSHVFSRKSTHANDDHVFSNPIKICRIIEKTIANFPTKLLLPLPLYVARFSNAIVDCHDYSTRPYNSPICECGDVLAATATTHTFLAVANFSFEKKSVPQ